MKLSNSPVRSTLCIGLLALASPLFADESSAAAVLYEQHCAQCHGLDLRGSAHGNSLLGEAFVGKWGLDEESASLDALLAYNVSSMPPGGELSLRPEDHQQLVAYLAEKNSSGATLSASNAAKADDNEAADSWSSADVIASIAKNRSAFKNKSLSDWRPVTTDMLNNPEPDDWLSWRRTLDGQGHSPLKQITRKNVNQLQLAWVLAMRDGSNQTTPLVHDGVMFLAHPGNIIQAIDARSGELIWEYAYQYPPAAKTLGGPQRNIALYDDKIFLATYDAALIALDAKTGELVWRSVKADYQLGYTHTSGPIVGNGVILSGINGCERYKEPGCFITGHDASTGKELWRTSTIALAGSPGDDSWAGLAAEFRAGSDTWIAGSFDSELNLFYIGTSQAKPWVAASRGMSTEDKALYTNSTLALNADTGEIVWFYQHVPGETIDMEVGFERVLVDKGSKRWLFTVGKDGLLWRLDRGTGKFDAVAETTAQDVFESINHETGEVRYRKDIVAAGIGDPIKTCPGIYGGHNWQAMAYSPRQQSLFIPLHNLCSELTGREVPKVVGEGGYGGDSRSFPAPNSNGLLGRLVSFDIVNMQERWRHDQAAMFMTGALTTAGDLVFIGDLDRKLNAFDSRNGKLLWSVRLGAPTHGYPITFAIDGEQYIAVPTGMGVFRAMTAVISPDIYQPANGQALYVFKLPQ
ncbi:MAG: PQQ-binding-like beta-propeller repeat protein [Pseudomonadales bacterium]